MRRYVEIHAWPHETRGFRKSVVCTQHNRRITTVIYDGVTVRMARDYDAQDAALQD